MINARAATAADRHLGARLREARLDRGMSQAALADAIGITFQQIQKYETGRNRISAGRLFDAGRVLDLQLDWFFEGLPAATAKRTARPTEIEQFVHRPYALRLARAFNRIGADAVRLGATEVVEAVVEAAESGNAG